MPIRHLPALFVLMLFAVGAPTLAAESLAIDMTQTVVKIPIEEGVEVDEAIDSMKLRANEHNMKFVGHLPLSEQLQNMGVDSPRLEIFQFCDPIIAGKMVRYEPAFAAYLPCRIAVVEEPDGKTYLTMLKLDILIEGTKLSPELHDLAVEVNDKLMDIIQAGASGDL